MLPADWIISTSHDTFALQFLWWKMLWNPSIRLIHCSFCYIILYDMIEQPKEAKAAGMWCEARYTLQKPSGCFDCTSVALVADNLKRQWLCMTTLLETDCLKESIVPATRTKLNWTLKYGCSNYLWVCTYRQNWTQIELSFEIGIGGIEPTQIMELLQQPKWTAHIATISSACQ